MMRIDMPGIQTLVQDRGRDGCYSFGMPPAGALDQRSYRIGNMLVGNDPNAAGLEFAFMGPSIAFEVDALIAVTGAEIEVFIDGEPQLEWTALAVRVGQTLSFGLMSKGSRGYIAVRGGVDVPLQLGSRSTYLTAGYGGHEGRALVAGDVLPIGSMTLEGSEGIAAGRSVPEELRPELASHLVLPVVEGLCSHRFTPESVELFFSSTFTVSHEANRTGYRFSGPSLEFVPREPPFGAGDDPSNVVSLGYPMGSIQIPGGAEPICLMRDVVTGGGYVTFGTVVSTELDRLAQLRTPNTVNFRRISFDEAKQLRIQARKDLEAVAGEIR
jgi:biotin-dependent carboxylase-like uncharacterized protein